MPSYLQTKLLRALQEREYRPVGSDRTVAVDVRLICATNVNVETALREGTLREDLYFRINTITLMVPPLRERTEDIPLLCEHFSEKFRRQYQKGVMGLSAPVHQLFMRYRWPGNVRELENVIERAVIVAKGREIELADLPEPLRNSVADTADFVVPPNYTLAEIEKMAIVQTLARTKGNKMEAAEMLGVVPTDPLQQDQEIPPSEGHPGQQLRPVDRRLDRQEVAHLTYARGVGRNLTGNLPRIGRRHDAGQRRHGVTRLHAYVSRRHALGECQRGFHFRRRGRVGGGVSDRGGGASHGNRDALSLLGCGRGRRVPQQVAESGRHHEDEHREGAGGCSRR